ncbi:amidase family protein [Microbulbifer epialgicus]|uniref:Amidase family protein n=1 Tax=Microbulbifer epialgicus TaxID=393907 RepID=A0ABV4NVR3_9GAMM
MIEESLDKAATNKALNAFITIDKECALAAAQKVDDLVATKQDTGPLCGIPLVIKDNINVEGMRTTAGTPGIDFIARSSAPVVEQLVEANAIIIGKSNMHELAFGVTSNNTAFGAVRNPKDLACFPGGSSGGTASAIAAGIVPAGLGTDTAGSVRLPAALTGIVGFRPTTQSLDQEGVVPSVPTFDVVGPMSQSVADTAYLYKLMGSNCMPQDKKITGLRLGVARPHSDELSSRVSSAFLQAQNRLVRAGATLVSIDLSNVVNAAFEVGFPIGFYQMKSAMTTFLAKFQPDTSLEDLVDKIASTDVKAVYQESVLGKNAPSEKKYRWALGELTEIQQEYLNIVRRHGVDAVIFPTAPIEAQPLLTSSEFITLNGIKIPTLSLYLRNLASTSVCSAPGITIPIGGTDSGLPVGLELDGRPDEDLELLAIATAVESALNS